MLIYILSVGHLCYGLLYTMHFGLEPKGSEIRPFECSFPPSHHVYTTLVYIQADRSHLQPPGAGAIRSHLQAFEGIYKYSKASAVLLLYTKLTHSFVIPNAPHSTQTGCS